MAETIKGINIVIGAETTGLQKSLSDVNKKSRDLQSELRQVERLLKLDPANTELLAQKQKLLAETVANSTEKLNRLRAAQEQVNEQLAKGEISEGQYRAFQREVAKTEQELQKLEIQGEKTYNALSDEKAVNNLKNLSAAAATAAIAFGAVFVAFAGKALEQADEMQRLSDVTGLSAERLQELQYAGNNLGVELTTITGAQAKLTKAMAAAKDDTKGTGAAFAKLGIDIRDSNGNLRDAKDVMFEAFTALNQVGNETERDALSMQLFGKSAMEMNPLIKAGGDELKKLTDEARNNGAVMSNEAVAGLDTFGDTVENLKTSILGKFGEKFAEMLPDIQAFLDGLKKIPAWAKKNETELGLLGIAVGTFATAILAYNIAAGWAAITTGLMTTATAAFGAVLAFVTSPITLIILAIGALVAVGYLLYKNWDKIKEIAGGAWEAISSAVSNAIAAIKEKIGSIVDAGKEIVRGIWEGITSMAGWLYNKIATFVKDNIVSPVKNFLGIESPSKVMAEFGRYVAEGLARGMDEGSEKVSEEAKKMTSAITGAAQAMLGKLNDALTITKAQLDLEATALSNNASEVDKLTIEQKKLNVEKDAAAAKVEILTAAYATAKKELGENNELTQSYAQSLMSAQIELKKQEILINKNTLAVKNAATAQVKAFQDIGDEIDAVEKKYQEELIAAAEEYQEKVAELNAQVIEDERRVTEEYENELESRKNALYDFVGLFDAVSTDSVSGQQLLDNLRGQVAAFDAWQENIAALAARGIDEGLLNELRGMGPEAGAEIAALNTLTNDELQEYVALWRTKNEEARNEAVNQLQEQKMEMEIKLFEIQAQAAEQLELYKQEWKKKNADIRKNTEEELNKIADKFNATAEKGTTYGVKLIMNYVAGIESGFDALRAAVEEAQSIAGEIDPTVRHSPSLVDRVQAGTAEIYKAYENLMSNMQGLDIGASLSLQGLAAGNTSSYMTTNHISITVQDGEDLLRTLHRLGVAIP